MIDFVKNANEVLQLIAFVLGIIGAPIAAWKYFEDGRRQRQATADELYQRYLERAMDYPKLSWPEGKIPDDEKYPWLVAIMLNALSAQLNCKPTGDVIEAIKGDLRVHRHYLASEEFKQEGGWSLFPKNLRELFGEIISEERKSVAPHLR